MVQSYTEENITWFDVGESQKKSFQEDFTSMPFTGLTSSIKNKYGHPLIKHQVGANFAFSNSKQKDVQIKHQQFIDKKVETWGESSSYTIDWNSLFQATQLMVSGVMEGDINKVQQAISYGADPNMTVSVLDPNMSINNDKPQYVTAPIGVSALMLGQTLYKNEKTPENKEKLQQFKKIAQLLLTHKDTPQIHVGNHPSDSGMALSYQSYGMRTEGNNAGADSIETRVIGIPLSLYNLVASTLPESMVENKVKEQSNGMVWGEDLPFEHRDSYLNMMDSQEESLNNKIQRFRERQNNKENVNQPIKNKFKL